MSNPMASDVVANVSVEASVATGSNASAACDNLTSSGVDVVMDASTLIQLQAAAFRSLCRHLEERSDLVSNMELMSISGFCRNCLAKWMVLEARRLVDVGNNESVDTATAALNAFGYEQAAEDVYGMSVDAWKERHQKKATPEQMERYQASSSLHAIHNADYLAVRGTDTWTVANSKPIVAVVPTATAAPPPVTLSSNVCCQDDDDDDDDDVATVTSNMMPPHESVPPPISDVVQAAPLGPVVPTTTRIDLSRMPNQQFPVTAILTVSDRAFAGLYETGDLSGPAVIQSIQTLTGLYDLDFITVVVPDDSAAIQAKLKILSNQGVDLILTTGGTGFSPRDVTPEATMEAVDSELTSLMPWVTTAVGRFQEQAHVSALSPKPWLGPTTALSRGTAGILHSTIVANLPGSPHAVTEIMPILLPLLLQAVAELHHMTPEILHIG